MNINSNYPSVMFTSKKPETLQNNLNRILKIMHVEDYKNVRFDDKLEGACRIYKDNKGRDVILYLDNSLKIEAITPQNKGKTFYKGLFKCNGKLYRYDEITYADYTDGFSTKTKKLNWFDKLKLRLFGI